MSVLEAINERILSVNDYAPYQVAIFFCAVWLVVALAGQLPVLIRHARGATDWQVVLFRGALGMLATAVVLRYFFDLNPWIIVVGWLALDIAATLNTIYIRRRARESAAAASHQWPLG